MSRLVPSAFRVAAISRAEQGGGEQRRRRVERDRIPERRDLVAREERRLAVLGEVRDERPVDGGGDRSISSFERGASGKIMSAPASA